VTYSALAELYDVKVPPAHTLPTTLRAMRPFAGMSPTEFETVNIKGRGGAKSIDIGDIANNLPEEAVLVFKSVGTKWGLFGPWHVRSLGESKQSPLVLKPGEQGLKLPTAGVRNIKFIVSPKGLTLESQPVRAGLTYSAEDARKMIYRGEQEQSSLVILGGVKGQGGAKL